MNTKTATANTITHAQSGELVKDMYNHVIGEFLPTAWNLFNKHFGVTSYRDLPFERFGEAREFIKDLMPGAAAQQGMMSDEIREKLAERENEDIEHGREICDGFISYQALRAIECMFPEERYSTMHTLCIPQEGLSCLFHLLATALRNDIEAHFGRY